MLANIFEKFTRRSKPDSNLVEPAMEIPSDEELTHELNSIWMPSLSFYSTGFYFQVNLMTPTNSSGRNAFRQNYIGRRNYECIWQGPALVNIARDSEQEGYVSEGRAFDAALGWIRLYPLINEINENLESEPWLGASESAHEVNDLIRDISDIAFAQGIDFHDAYVWALLEEQKICDAYMMRRMLPPLDIEDFLATRRAQKQARRRRYRARAKTRDKFRRNARYFKRLQTLKVYTHKRFGSENCHFALINPRKFSYCK